MKGSRFKKPVTIFIALIGLTACSIFLISQVHLGDGRAYAESSEASPTELSLPTGRKLVDVSWRCFGDYPCRPFVLTRSMRKDESAETYVLSSPYRDAADSYVIKETR